MSDFCEGCDERDACPDRYGVSDWSLPREAATWLRDHVRPNSTVHELGSGEGTLRLAEWFDVVTVEHDEEYLDMFPSSECIHYIHCPIVGNWYDAEVLRAQLPARYSAIVVDGPPGNIGRWGFMEHLDMFADVPILFDDIHRAPERELAMAVAHERKQSLSMHLLTDDRAFGVVGMI